MRTEWRLERTYLAGLGKPESRLEGLDLAWSRPLEPTAHTALWADNGTGKTMITALRHALYLPNARDFIRGGSDRSLAQLVRSGDVCHVVEQATRVDRGEFQRMVVGMVASWPDGASRDLENPSRLRRVFYGWLTDPNGPTIDDLPLRTDIGRWSSHTQFVTALRDILPGGGAIPPHTPSDRQGEWRRWLDTAGVDMEQIRFQAVMNASEGGVDALMRFTDSDAFVRWLLGATMPTATVEQINNSIDRLRENAAARPHWDEELRLWEQILEPLLNLAIAHEQVQRDRGTATTAEAEAAGLLADADETVKVLVDREQRAKERFEQHDQNRRDAGRNLRNAQAHRLRMRLRAAELRVHRAQQTAFARKQEFDRASRVLAAWQSVQDVLLVKETTSKLAHLEERRDAAELDVEHLGQKERHLRASLARLLTVRRDEATDQLEEAIAHRRTAHEVAAAADSELVSFRAKRATTAERQRLLKESVRRSEQVISTAFESGLLGGEEDPTDTDIRLELWIAEQRAARDEAEEHVGAIADETSEVEGARANAEQLAESARKDARAAEEQTLGITRRVEDWGGDQRLLDVAPLHHLDLWADRGALNEALQRRTERSDEEASSAKANLAEARRVISSVGADGLLPPSQVVEEAAHLCRDAEVAAWSGWRWLAGTMESADAAAFATARPEIASGIVVAHPDLLDRAVEVIAGINLDSALWIGCVIDPHVAALGEVDETGGATRAHVLLPPAGVFDQDAARTMVASAEEKKLQAEETLRSARDRARTAREVQAELEQFWSALPEDPRPVLEERIHAAGDRRREAERDERTAAERLEDLTRLRSERDRERKAANEAVESMSETRRLLVPVITAHRELIGSRGKLPELRETLAALDDEIDNLESRRPLLAGELEKAGEKVNECVRTRDDAIERLRSEGLSATLEGALPDEGEEVIRARLDGTRAALEESAVPPELNDAIERHRGILADTESRLDTDRERRRTAERFADTDGARHTVALETSISLARDREDAARVSHAKADIAADQIQAEYEQRINESADRSYPDVEGYPPAEETKEPSEAEQHARRLDDLTQELIDQQRREERLANEQNEDLQRAASASKLVTMSVNALRHFSDPGLSGQSVDDIDQLVERAERVSTQVRTTAMALAASERRQRSQTDSVRAHANGPLARKVEDRESPRIVDLIRRLRADERLHVEAEHLAGHLEQRIATLRDDLANHQEHVRTCASMLHLNADSALLRLRAYQNQSRLPGGLGEWSDRNFVIIDHEPAPTDESVAVDRVARVVHSQLTPSSGRSDAQTMLFAATRALVDAPFKVRILKPHTDMRLDRVDVSGLKDFSGGQRVTAGVLLYATMTRVRGAGEATSIGWLWLDNPFGQASADQFIKTMRLAADKLGLQLLFTAAPKDKGALSMFDRITMLARRARPSSKENVVVLGNTQHELVDLTLIQREVTEVLGE